EIADVVAFIASEKAAWIVGSTVNVDGGQSKMNF
ncbi:MAG TPA: short-chain dehydrogenase, partial [Metalysinibacillus sp.]